MKQLFSIAGCIFFLALNVFHESFAVPKKAYVGNFADNSISVIDIRTNKVIKTIPMSPAPSNMAISPNGKYIYVSDSGADTVTVIDTTLDRAVSHFAVGKIPQGIAVSPSGNFLLVCVIGTNSIIYATTKNTQYTADAKILIGKTNEILLDPNKNLAYASLIDNKQYAMALVDIAKKTAINAIPLQNPPKSMTFGPRNRIYFTAEGVNAIQVYSTSENKVIQQIPVGSSLGGITMAHNNQFGAVTSQNNGMLYLFDPLTYAIKEKIPVGIQPYSVAFSQDDKTAYVVNEGSNNVLVIDLANKKVIATINVGKSPHYIVLTR